MNALHWLTGDIIGLRRRTFLLRCGVKVRK